MRRLIVSSVLVAGLALAGFGGAALEWKRQYVGKTPLSLEAPVSIGAGVTEKVTDPMDWVGQMTDYMAETDSYYLQITVFEAKDQTVATYKKLASVMGDTVEVLADEALTVKFTANDKDGGEITLVPVEGKTPKAKVELTSSMVGKIDEKPVIMATINREEKGEKSVLKLALVGDGKSVYAVFGVGFPEYPDGVKDLDRIMKSIRYKTGL